MQQKTPFGVTQHEFLQSQDWNFPVPIFYGPGRLAEIGKFCGFYNISNPLIVTDRGSKDLQFIQQTKDYLSGSSIASSIFFEISPNPRDDEIEAGKRCFLDGQHDAIIAIGGGSAMDGGKSIGLTAWNEHNLWDFEWEKDPPEIPTENGFPALITIPTTAGTGAEAEGTAMVTHVEKGMKFCICHPNYSPSFVILDPELTLALPKSLTAWTGADALTHAIEAYLVPGFNPLCDGLALEGLALIAHFLPLVVKQPDNLQARSGMLVGSCLAGISFRKGLGFVHAISHMVGAEYDTQHGLTNAIVLPVILRFNLQDLDEKTQRIAEAMKLTEKSNDAVCVAVEGLLDEIDIPKSLSEIGIPLDCAERISHKSLKDSAYATNPRAATAKEMQSLIEEAIVKARQ